MPIDLTSPVPIAAQLKGLCSNCNVLPQCPKLIDLVSVDPRMIIFLPLPDLSPLPVTIDPIQPVTINSYMHVSNPCYIYIVESSDLMPIDLT